MTTENIYFCFTVRQEEQDLVCVVPGDEAVERLLACKDKDMYSILGVARTSTEEEIKRHYRKQAMLVHPDKVSCFGNLLDK